MRLKVTWLVSYVGKLSKKFLHNCLVYIFVIYLISSYFERTSLDETKIAYYELPWNENEDLTLFKFPSNIIYQKPVIQVKTLCLCFIHNHRFFSFNFWKIQEGADKFYSFDTKIPFDCILIDFVFSMHASSIRSVFIELILLLQNHQNIINLWTPEMIPTEKKFNEIMRIINCAV